MARVFYQKTRLRSIFAKKLAAVWAKNTTFWRKYFKIITSVPSLIGSFMPGVNVYQFS
jgi:hypothetical protein